MIIANLINKQNSFSNLLSLHHSAMCDFEADFKNKLLSFGGKLTTDQKRTLLYALEQMQQNLTSAVEKDRKIQISKK